MQLKLKRKSAPIRFDLRLSPMFWEKAGKIVVGDIVTRVERQLQPDGARIKRNAPATREKKRREGKNPMLSLIDTGTRFVRASGYGVELLPQGRGVRVYPRAQDVARRLVAAGYRWVGLGRQGVAALRALLREEIRRLLHAAERRAG